MRIGFIGLGKLGLPIALAMESCGHEVAGWDTDHEIHSMLSARELPCLHRHPRVVAEAGMTELAARTKIRLLRVPELAAWSEVVFVCVQTPHRRDLDGSLPLTGERADFDYTHLVAACRELSSVNCNHAPPVGVVSTVLPGTMRREIVPILGDRLVYTPAFPAMGTAIVDFLEPEFMLIGSQETPGSRGAMAAVHAALTRCVTHSTPVLVVSIESAELAKVAYNTFIGMKVVFGNHLADIAEETGADVDEVVSVLAAATRRVVSPAYLSAGMGDGGACHPRDNLALSWLARHIREPFDLAGAVMEARDLQSRDLAARINEQAAESRLPVVVLGKSYKADSPLTAGSPAALLVHHLAEIGIAPAAVLDPVVEPGSVPAELERAVYVVATNHSAFDVMPYPPGSVVIDPWGSTPNLEGVTVVRHGRRPYAPAPITSR